MSVERSNNQNVKESTFRVQKVDEQNTKESKFRGAITTICRDVESLSTEAYSNGSTALAIALRAIRGSIQHEVNEFLRKE